jgi:hypothetical protein
MSLKLNSSGGGSVTVQEPSTASNRTLTLPDATTTAVGTDATQTLSNKTFSGAQTFGTASLPEPSGSAPLYLARAWVNFNGTGTVAITASGNVSSITDNGVGNYTVNFATALSDANYNFVTNSSNTTSANILCIAQLNWDAPTKTTSALRIYNLKSNTGALTDQDTISVSIFR